MVEGESITRSVIATLEDGGFRYLLVGSFSSNLYGIPRSTKDADFVIDLAERSDLARLVAALNPVLEFDPQVSFEGLTGSVRHEASARTFPFRVEFFELSDDAFARARFARRVRIHSSVFGREIWIPTPEDVVIQKLRWFRDKDRGDARDVLTVQGPALDFPYIEDWCRKLEILDRYEAVRATVPEI